jgi:type IV pilus secretin PilQ/predicted competence protein
VNFKRLAWIGGMAALLFLGFGAPPAGSIVPGKLVSLDADDASLPAVLKILAEKGDLNIITGPGVASGKLTIHMKDVPVEQAVNLVVRAAGLAYERIGNSILVAEQKSLQTETGLSAYIVNLRFADANEVKQSIHGLTEQVEVDRSGNRLIIVTSPRIISEIQEIVAEIDKPARQVMLEARIVEVSTDDAKKLGVDWDLLNRQGFTFVEGTYDKITADDVENPGKLTDANAVPNTPGTDNIWGLRNFTRAPKVFRAFLDLMIHNGSARVLANPKIATLNGKEATMLVGQRIPFVVTGTTFAGGGAAQTQSVQKEEVGIKLAITPLINADGWITTTIRPEVSSVTGYNGANKDLPVIATRQASTTVRLRDSSSVIIGGLLNEEHTTTETRLPILGDLPGVGWLFRHTSTTAKKTDLVIEVTPHILPEQP